MDANWTGVIKLDNQKKSFGLRDCDGFGSNSTV